MKSFQSIVRSQKWLWSSCLLVMACICGFFYSGCAVDASALKEGMRGAEVAELQKQLTKIGFYSGPTNGRFGPLTKAAVVSFQDEVGLKTDGIAGDATITAIRRSLAPQTVTYTVASGDNLWDIAKRFKVSVSSITKANSLNTQKLLPVGKKLVIPASGVAAYKVSRGVIASQSHVVALPWATVNTLFKSSATITDVKTGITLSVRRRGGTLHADVEPETAEDTKRLKAIYGSHWSWARRAVIVRIGVKTIAASINGMPHGGSSISNNGFSGHFCVHFLGSRIHKSGKVDEQHQAMVRYATR